MLSNNPPTPSHVSICNQRSGIHLGRLHDNRHIEILYPPFETRIEGFKDLETRIPMAFYVDLWADGDSQ